MVFIYRFLACWLMKTSHDIYRFFGQRLRGQFHRAAILCCVCCLAGPPLAMAEEKPATPALQDGEISYYPNAPRDETENGTGDLTMASRTLPKKSHAEVTNKKNNETVCVTVTDSGPYRKDKKGKPRVADLSTPAAREVDLTKKDGVTQAIIKPVEACPPKPKAPPKTKSRPKAKSKPQPR